LSAASLRKEIFAIGVAGAVIGLAAVSVKLINYEYRPANQTAQARYLAIFYDRENSPRVKARDESYLQMCNFFDGASYTAKPAVIPENCVAKQSGGVFLWGDSHAQALSFGVRKYLADSFSSVAFSQVASSGCRPHLSDDSKTTGEFKKSCDRSNAYAIQAIKRVRPAVVIMAQRDEHTENNLPQIAQELVRLGIEKVLIIGPVPQWNIDLPRIIARHYWDASAGEIEDSNFKRYLIAIDRELAKSVSELQDKRIEYVSVLGQLCISDGRCMAILDQQRTPLVFDYGHLTKEGSVYVVDKVLSPYLEDALKSN
jgi:hypothetical protein